MTKWVDVEVTMHRRFLVEVPDRFQHLQNSRLTVKYSIMH